MERTRRILRDGVPSETLAFPYANGVLYYVVKKGATLRKDGRPRYQKDILSEYVVFNEK